MKHEDEAQSCTSKTEKKEARKNTFLEIMLQSDYLEFLFFVESYCYAHYTIHWQKPPTIKPPRNMQVSTIFIRKDFWMSSGPAPTDSSASLHRANVEQTVANTDRQMRNS